MNKILEVKGLSKSFRQAKEEIVVFKDVNLAIEAGESVSISGESGSGKSTFLQIIGLLQAADSGEIFIDGKRADNLSDRKKTLLRREKLGFVYQYHHLLSDFTALENVMMPLLINGKSKKESKEQAAKLLDQLGVSNRLSHKPSELSGGQQQRVAIARALANNPKIVFADEPTGNLDAENTENVLNLFFKLAAEIKTTLVIATHNKAISSQTDHSYIIKDGSLMSS
jgi:lipoprotein-releasing system ATP-binding protein